MATDASQKRQTLLGALIIAGALAFCALIFLMGDVSRLFERHVTVVAVLPESPGLKPGSPVWIAGHHAGEVSTLGMAAVDSDSMARVLVHLKVYREYWNQLRSDSEVRITSARLIGEPAVDILPGTLGAAPLDANDTLRLRTGSSTAELRAKASQLTAQLDELAAEVKQLAPRARRRAGEAQRLMRRLEMLAGGLRAFMDNIEGTPLRMFADPEFQRIIEQVQASVRQLGSAFRGAAERAQAARAQAAPALERLAARADTISAELRRVQQALAAGGSLGRFQSDSALAKTLQRTRAQLDSLIAETKRDPLRFWF